MKYLSMKALQEKFGVSRSTIDKWRRELGFPSHYTLGEKKLFWLEDEVDKWAKRKMERAA
jgi:predicted DNA-binding transcriptional regulator AlpA